MRIEDLTVALRPRTAWEAVELGTTLARRHVMAVWKPWLLLSLPVLVLVNALGWAIDAIWLAGIAMWWLKPAFARVPLYVLSRAVFGHVPTTKQTLRAQWSWGRRWLPAYLTWRRLSPVRSLYLPVDLLEGGAGEEARARRRALGAPVYGVGAMLTLVFVHFEIALSLGALAGVMLFVPNEFVQETAARLWNVLEAQPVWLQFCLNAVTWLATTALEPFYVGAGFGLYLNRRTEIEAWDIEMALRRLRARLTQTAAPLLLLCVVSFGALPAAQAQDEPPPLQPRDNIEASAAEERSTLREVFGPQLVDDAGWRQAVKRAYEDPKVSPKRKVTRWVPKNPKDPKDIKNPDLGALAAIFAAIGEYGLWIVFGALVLALLLTARKWLPWLRDTVTKEGRETREIQRETLPEAAPLPGDIPTEARRLWRSGRERDALALVYRASVESMAQRASVVLVPGATEAHTLRASRQLPSAGDREIFARTVRTWQIAAYAHGLPATEEFEELLTTLSHRFAWSATGVAA
ncbi:MAG TPA: DUF4129 domain-containing protein [Lysobacter sp.]|nr:DUF4129 domain-containing protein [Lysobacter sp.]